MVRTPYEHCAGDSGSGDGCKRRKLAASARGVNRADAGAVWCFAAARALVWRCPVCERRAMAVDPQSFFSPDYPSARDSFSTAAEARTAIVSAHPIASRGLADEELAVDVAYLGPESPASVILVSSGVHGVEGFAGSAIQHQLLESQLDGLSVPADTGLLLVHAVNPFGFAHLRRVNENNVDLNRNFLVHPDEEAPNSGYEELAVAINPTEMSEESEAAHLATILGYAAEHGNAELQAVLTKGQYARPDGVQFGGNQDEESNRIIRSILRTELRGARRLVWLDLHTGLGPYGDYELVSQHEVDDPAYARGKAWFGGKVLSTRAGESVSAYLHGDMLDGALAELADEQEVTAFAPEFGTYEPTRVFLAMRADNWLQHHGDLDSEQGQAIKRELLEVFRPADAKWQAMVLAGGGRVIEQAVAAVR